MPATRVAGVLAAAALAAGCSAGDDERRASPVCTAGPDVIAGALRAAPGPVRLDGGVPLSSCISDAVTDAEVQNVGAAMVSVAERLERRATGDARAALELGYLIGAMRRGAARSMDIHAELVRRIERTAQLDGASAAIRAAVDRGLRAGRSRG